MKYEVTLEYTVTITVEAESEEQATELARGARYDSYVTDEAEENCEVTCVEELIGMDYNSVYVDSDGQVSRQ